MDKKNIAKTAGIALAASLVTGLAIAAPALAAPTPSSNTFSAEQVGKKGKGQSNQAQAKVNDVHVAQDITVVVPDDGATYKLVVTQTAPPATASSNAQAKGLAKNHSFVVAVTGTGSVTVSVPGLHPGTYTADLVKVSSSQTVTVTAPAAASTTN